MAETTPELAQYQSDHDILIELRTEMRLLRETVKESGAGVSRTIDDHEKRLRDIEREANRFMGKQSIVSSFVALAVSIASAAIFAWIWH